MTSKSIFRYLTASLIYNDFDARDGFMMCDVDLFGVLKDDNQQKEEAAFFLFRDAKRKSHPY